jgi:hypothetical protein
VPQSLAAVYIHLVYSTKLRTPLFRDKPVREDWFSCLGGITKKLECPSVIVGGYEDHVHLLCRFGRTITWVFGVCGYWTGIRRK